MEEEFKDGSFDGPLIEPSVTSTTTVAVPPSMSNNRYLKDSTLPYKYSQAFIFAIKEELLEESGEER